MSWDTLIKNALVFDGCADVPAQQDVAIQDGKVAEVGPDLDAGRAAEVVDAEGSQKGRQGHAPRRLNIGDEAAGEFVAHALEG